MYHLHEENKISMKKNMKMNEKNFGFKKLLSENDIDNSFKWKRRNM